MRARAAARVAAGPADVLADLLNHGERGWVVSCYQKLEPADRAADKYRIKLKNRLRRAAARLEILGFDHDEREMLRDALERIEAFFRHPSNLDGGRGVAVFAGTGFFRAVRLPYVLKSRILVDRTPVVGELVALSEARARVLVAVTDRREARFFDVDLAQATELDGFDAPPASKSGRFKSARSDAPGLGEYRFHNRIREDKHRHLARTAEHVEQLMRRTAYDGLLIGGVGVDAKALGGHFSQAFRDQRMVGVLSLTPKQVTTAEISRLVAEFLDDRTRVRAERDVEALAEARGTGWAADGVEPTLRALARGQVATLLVDHDAEVAGYRCAGSGRLTTEPTAARGEGELLPIADVLDDAMEEALRQRARVAVVRGAPARTFARLAGILRFQGGA